MRFRQIHTRIWKDTWFMNLSKDEKLFYIYLFSNDQAALSGIYELPIKFMTFETGLTETEILAAFKTYAEAGKAWYEDCIVMIPNLRKYHETRSPSVQTAIIRGIESVQDCPLKQKYFLIFPPPEQAENTGSPPPELKNNQGEISLTLPHTTPADVALQEQAKEWSKLPKLGSNLNDAERVVLRDVLLQAVNKNKQGAKRYTYDGGKKETKLKEVIAYCNIRQVPPKLITYCFCDDDGFWYTESFGRLKQEPPHPKNIINEMDKAAEWYNDRYMITR